LIDGGTLLEYITWRFETYLSMIQCTWEGCWGSWWIGDRGKHR